MTPDAHVTRRLLSTILVLAVLFVGASAGRANEQERPEPDRDGVRDIGDRRELFVDEWLIESFDGTTLRLHPAKPEEIIVELNQPWTGPVTGFTTVLKDGDLYRLYVSTDQGLDYTSYFESTDGVHWVQPSLGIVEFEGSTDNNIVFAGQRVYNFSVFRDENPAAPPEQRYKAVGGGPPRLFVSPDALHWKPLREEPVFTDGPYDSQNLAFWDPLRGLYVAYLRHFLKTEGGSVRHIRTATSPDFLNWSASTPIDTGSAPLEHLYTNAITPYFRAPHLYVGFPMRHVEERHPVASHPLPGVADGVFISSRDGLHFSRRFLESFIEPGIGPENWTDRTNLPTSGVVPTGEHEMSVYCVEHYRHPTIRIRRGSLRLDGFASVHADPDGGEFTTRPLKFQGRKLTINFRTSAPGSIRVALLNANGAELPGFGVDDCVEIYGNEIERTVAWQGGEDVGALAGEVVRLRFVMRDADLFSLRFAP